MADTDMSSIACTQYLSGVRRDSEVALSVSRVIGHPVSHWCSGNSNLLPWEHSQQCIQCRAPVVVTLNT